VHELYLVAHLGGVLLKLVINWWLFGCYTRRETTSVFGMYKHHLGVAGWEGVEDSLDELGRIRKTTLDFGGERQDKISVLTKEQKEIIEKLGFADALFGL